MDFPINLRFLELSSVVYIFETVRVSSEISIVVQYQMSRLYFSQQTQPADQLFNIVVSDPE